MDENDEELSDLLGQLKQNNTFTNKAIRSNEDFNLPKEKLEEFILNTSGRLVQDSLDMIDIVKERVASAAEPDDVASLSELFKASTSTVEALNKILIQDNKTMTSVAMKQMDIEAKKEIAQQESEGRFLASREEMMKQLVKDAKIIDVTEEKDVN